MNNNKSVLKAEFEIKTIEGQIKNLCKLIFGQAAGSETGLQHSPAYNHFMLKDLLGALSNKLNNARRRRTSLEMIPAFVPA